MKTPSTFLSRPKDQLDSRIRPERERLNLKTCPECGEKAIQMICSDYRTDMGYLITDLEHFHCGSCGADFFDTEAMDRIIKEGRLSAKSTPKTQNKEYLEKDHA